MASITINGITFNNVPKKKQGITIGNFITQSNIKATETVNEYLLSDRFYALVSALDIDWSGIQAEENIEINSTSDLINWIKSLPVKGLDGITPHIENGNWFIGDADTGISAIGLQGEQGLKGDTGEQGPKGDPGDDAYQIAVKNGFNGTVEEWIESLKGADGTMSFEDLTEEQRESLVGETGPVGPSAYQSYLDTTTDNPKLSESNWIASLHGQDGAVGPQGPTGQSGITPHIDPVTKHWIIGESDTNVLAEGQAGITPHIESGYWFIGDTNTEIKAQGSDGKSTYEVYCETVPEGQTPMTQSEWLNSLKGPTGPDGIPGEKGDKGDKGDKGEKGDTGEGFQIYKTYLTIQEMDNDAANVQEGKFVMIASSVEDEDNSKLYVKNTQGGFTYINDLSGAQGIKGENGITPHIGDNGHWFIGDDDTNVIAQGLNGISPELPLFKTINGEEITGEGDITINGGSAQVQANWNESDNTKVSYILNKPSIPTKTSDLTNDKNFVTKLALQTDYYTKIEINNKLGDIGTVSEVVDGLVVSRDATVEDKINELLNTISEVDHRHDLNKIYNSFYDLTWFTSTTCKLKIDENTTSELSYNRYFALMLFEMSAMSEWVPIGRIQIKGTSENSYSNLLINLLNYDGTNVTTFKMLGHFSINLNSIIEVLSPNNLESYNEYIITASWSGIDITILNYKKLNADYSYDEPTSTLNINQ